MQRDRLVKTRKDIARLEKLDGCYKKKGPVGDPQKKNRDEDFLKFTI
jgi:hypothetical protein